jgi:hypothetical protein
LCSELERTPYTRAHQLRSNRPPTARQPPVPHSPIYTLPFLPFELLRRSQQFPASTLDECCRQPNIVHLSAPIMASNSRTSIDSNNLASGALSPIHSPTASVSELSVAYPPRSSSARPRRPRRPSDASSVVSFSSVGTTMDWRVSKEFGGGANNGANSTGASRTDDVKLQAPTFGSIWDHSYLPRVMFCLVRAD